MWAACGKETRSVPYVPIAPVIAFTAMAGLPLERNAIAVSRVTEPLSDVPEVGGIACDSGYSSYGI